MKKNVKHFLVLTALAAGTIHVTNRFIDTAASRKNLLSKYDGSYYDWKNGTIYYSKRGKGNPLLLVHDLTPASSSFEWDKIIRKLEKNHTVYTIDLLGCGRSDKPNLTYTNYLYVQLLSDFIKEIIAEKTDLISTGNSCSFTIMAAHMHKDLFGEIICINPESLTDCDETPDKLREIRKYLLGTPILGTFIYNIEMSRKNIDTIFRSQYFQKPQLISHKYEDAYYESSHREKSSGKYLLGSIYGRYTNISVTHALPKFEKPIHFIGSRGYRNAVQIVDSYVHYNSKFETAYLSNCKKLPQLEVPDKLTQVIETFLEK